MKLNPQQLRLALSLSFMLVFASGFYFLNSKIGQNHALSKEMSGAWQAEEERRQQTQKFGRAIKEIEDKIVELNTHFVKNQDLVPFLNSIENMAPRAGIDLETTAVDVSADKKSLIVGLKTRGSFEANYKFINMLENSPYELEIASIDLFRGGGQTDQSPQWESTINLRLLSFIP